LGDAGLPDGARMVSIISERDLVRTFATKGSDFHNLAGARRLEDTGHRLRTGCQHASGAGTDKKESLSDLPVIEAGRVLGTLSIRDALAPAGIRSSRSTFCMTRWAPHGTADAAAQLHADEDHERRHEKSAADAEHPRAHRVIGRRFPHKYK